MATINGNDENNTLEGTNLADTLNGLGGNDTLHGNDGADVLNGGGGNDWLEGGAGSDTYKFALGGGNDTVGAGNATDTDTADLGIIALNKLAFAANGSDFTISLTGNDSSINTLTLEDWLTGESGVKKFKIGASIYTSTTAAGGGTVGADFMAAASDTGVSLSGGAGADILVGGAGNDSLDGALGNDGIYAGGGNDTITSGAGSDYVQAGDGNDLFLYTTGDVLTTDTLDGGAGMDTLNASAFTTALSVVMSGTTAKISGIEVVLGGSAADTITGGNEDNLLSGNGGNDILTGGGGNDTLAGGSGSDSYLFASGYGNDIILSDSANANDTVKLDAKLSLANFSISQDNANLILSTGQNENITLADWYTADTGKITNFTVGTSTFKVSSAGTANADFLIGSDEAEELSGGAGNDFIYAGDGDDIIHGGAGGDIIFGGAGADLIVYDAGDAPATDILVNGGAGDDTLDASAQISAVTINMTGTVFTNIENVIGGAGGDVITGGNDANVLDGGAGGDMLRGMGGDDILLGGAGADTLDGGAGNDTLDGGAGNDIYSFSAGFGNDTIGLSEDNVNDTIAFDTTIAMNDLVFQQDGSNLIITVKGNDHLVLENWFDGGTSAIQKFKVGATTFSFVQTGNDANNNLIGQNTFGDMLFGAGGNDTLSGLGGDDKLFGGDGNDTLDGGLGNDFLDGGDGADVILGGAGADQIIYDSNDLVISGGDGIDTLDARTFVSGDGYGITYSLVGSDIEQILGSDYIDSLVGGSAANLLSGGAGDDILEGKGGADTLIGGDGADRYVFGPDAGGNDVIVKDVSNRQDTLVLTGIADLSNSTRLGNDLIIDLGAQGKVTLKSWNEGADYAITNVSMDDALYSLYAGSVLADTLIGGDSNDIMLGMAGANKIDGGAGNDIVYGGLAADSLAGSDGDDTLFGEAGADTLNGGAGNDILIGGNDADVYHFDAGFGNDTILAFANNANDIVEFSSDISESDIDMVLSGNDLVITLEGEASTDTLTLENWKTSAAAAKVTKFRMGGQLYTIQSYLDASIAGSSTITGTASSELIIGGDADNIITGNAGDDILIGSGGNDNLNGGDGNDRIDGGDGNDILTGGLGNDTYIFGADSGNDIIVKATGNNLDKIKLADGTGIGDVSVELSGNDLILYAGASSLTIQGWNEAAGYKLTSLVAGNETFVLGNSVQGNDDNNSNLTGSALADMINGLGGDDVLTGLGGNDLLIGGAGNDTLSGGAGSDTYRFIGTSFGNDTITGANDNSTDKLVFDFDAGSEEIDGSPLNYFEFTRPGGSNDLIVTPVYGNAESSVTLLNWYVGTNKIKQFVINGQTYSIENFVQGNDLNNSLTGTGTLTNIFSGMDGNDTISGGTGNDLLYGGNGADSLIGGLGNDELYGDAGSDTLLGGDGNDLLVDRDGAESDANLLDGGAGNDTLRAEGYYYNAVYGTGDTLLGGLGDDVLDYAGQLSASPVVGDYSVRNMLDGGAGNDTISVEQGYYLNVAGGIGNDVITFTGVDTTPLTMNAYLDTVDGGAGNDTLTISGYSADIVSLYGGNDNDLLIAEINSGYRNLLDGGAGNDELRSATYTEDYTDRASDVTLRGGLGNDTYTISNKAFTTVDNSNGGTNNTDFIRFFAAEDNQIADYTFSQSGNDLELQLGDDVNDVVLRVSNWFLGSAYQVQRIVFSDGTLTAAQINNKVFIGKATEEADSLTGSDYSEQMAGLGGNDTMVGLGGNDLLDGGSGNDLLIGGAGNDTVIGGLGNDTIVYDGNQSLGTVYGNDGTDVFDASAVGQGIKVSSADLQDFEIFLGGSGSDAISRSGLNSAVTLIGGEGDDTLVGGSAADVLDGGNGNDVLSGGASADTITGGAGNDTVFYEGLAKQSANTISGGAGNDILTAQNTTGGILISAGDFADFEGFIGGLGNDTLDRSLAAVAVTLAGGLGNDVLIGGSGNDAIDGGSGTDTADYSAFAQGVAVNLGAGMASGTQTGNDTLLNIEKVIGSSGNDMMSGSSAADSLYGGLGNDTLSGAGGNDWLAGGTGADVYVFGSGMGSDTIAYDSDNANDTLFLMGLSSEDVTYTHSTGGDTFQINGSDEKITILGGSSAYSASTAWIGHVVFSDGLIYEYMPNDSGGTDYIWLPATGNDVTGTDGADTLIGTRGRDTIDGAGGDDIINGLGSDDILSGGNGNDVINGGAGSDVISGGAGNDIVLYDGTDAFANLSGGDGNDTLDAGAYSGAMAIDTTQQLTDFETIIAGSGNDSLVWDGVTSLVGGAGIDTLAAGNASVTVTADLFTDFEVFVGGSGGDILDRRGLSAAVTMFGGEGGDDLFGGSGSDWLDGGSGNGNNIVRGGSGNDTLVFHAGQRTDGSWFTGDAGTDTFDARQEANDVIITSTVLTDFEIFLGGSGNDSIDRAGTAAAVTLQGYAGNDVLIGGNGNDWLSGGAGSDNYVFAQGFGNDTVSGESANLNDLLTFAMGGDDDSTEITPTRSGNDLILTFSYEDGAANDSLTLQNWYVAANKITQFQFDGEIQIINDVLIGNDTANSLTATVNNAVLYGNGGADTLTGAGGSDMLDGGAGNDILKGLAGNDELGGGLGNDVLYGGNDNDYLYSDNGADTLNGENGNDTLIAYNTDANDPTAGNAKLYGGNDDDYLMVTASGGNLLDGGAGNDTLCDYTGNDHLAYGNDTLTGGAGNDIYLVSANRYDDVIVINNNTSANGNDVFALAGNDYHGSPLNSNLFSYSNDSGDLVISSLSGDALFRFSGWFTAPANQIETFVFEDQTYTNDDITGFVTGTKHPLNSVYGTAGSDTLVGGDKTGTTNETVYGLGGNDTLQGFGGNDTLSGGAGNDVLAGGAGNDVYFFNKGNGYDAIDNTTGFETGDADIVAFGSGITTDSIDVRQDGDDLLIAVLGNDGTWPDMLVLEDWFMNTDSQVSGFTFADGRTAALSAAEMTALAAARSEVLRAESSDISLTGTDGNDWLYGSPGDQLLTGGGGDDVYIWGDGDGNDMIDSRAGSSSAYMNGCDTALIGFNANDCWVQYGSGDNPLDLVLGIGTYTDGTASQTLTFDNWFSGSQYQVDTLVFADGTTKSAAQITALLATQGSHKDL